MKKADSFPFKYNSDEPKCIFYFSQHCNQSHANALANERHLNLIDSIGLMSKFKLVFLIKMKNRN